MRLSTMQSAVLFMFGAAILVAGTSIMAKTLGLSGDGFEGLHAFQVSAGRYFFGFCTLLTFTLLRPAMRPSFEGTAWPVHAIRALVGWMGVTAMFAAVAAMPIAEATAISFLNPLIAMILAVMFLGENLNAKKLIAAALSIAGAVMILRPGGESFQIAGLYALFAAICMGAEIVIVKRLTDKEPALRILLINNLIGATIALTAASFVWLSPTALQWGLLILLGATMVSAQSMFVQSLKRGEASAVSLVFYSVLVFAALYDALFYGVIPSMIALIGSGLIIGGAIVLAMGRRA